MVHFISRRTSWWQVGTISPAPDHLIWRGGQTADSVTQSQFLADVRGQSSSGDVLIWVHGFNTHRTTALQTTKTIKAAVTGHGFKGAVIAYDWPTSSETGVRGIVNRLLGLKRMYIKDKETANAMDDTLVKNLASLFKAPGIKVHIMAHSMGCYLTTLGIRHAESWLGQTVPFEQI
ncbi:alpha/beta hydrolase, partial [Octadecabacter sp.]|nr:alpha/beta hydrolase [Octadecabacter sp.]